MTIRCLAISPHHADETHEIDLDGELDDRRVFYVRLPATFEIEYLDFELDRILGNRSDEADLVLVRLHSRLFEQIESSEEVRNAILKRFGYAIVRVIHWDQKVLAHALLDWLTLAPVVDATILDIARSIDFEIGLEEPGALLPANPEFHYDGPNGLHYESFVRASYAFQSTDAIEGAAFWILPYLSGVNLIVLDSWTMLGLGHIVASYAQRELSAVISPKPEVECGEEYGEAVYLETRLSARVQEARGGVRALLITSVHSTGATESRVIGASEGAGVEVAWIVRIYSNQREDREATAVTLHFLREAIEPVAPGHCSSCLHARKSNVPIDRRSLLLTLTAAVEETRITINSADSARSFLEAYADVAPVSIHRTDVASNRHQMLYVDVERLLGSREFRSRLQSKIDPLREKFDLVLSPQHDAAVAFGAAVAERLDVHHLIADQKHFGDLAGEDRASLFGAESILFVDDVMITGNRLRRVKTELMHNRVITDKKDVSVSALVAVARPENANSWLGTQNMTGKLNLHWVEYLELPNWAEDECPWCWELAKLNEFGASHPLSDYLEERVGRLRNVEEGLRRDLFLASSSGAGGMTRSLGNRTLRKAEFGSAAQSLNDNYRIRRGYEFSELGQGSIFGRLKEVELFTAVAAAVQNLRNQKKLSDRPQYPLARVLDPYLYFLGRFYANIIVVSILRAVRRRDIRTVNLEGVLRQATGLRLSESESREIQAELMLAISQTKLPLPQETAIPDTFEEMDSAVSEFLRWLVLNSPEPHR